MTASTGAKLQPEPDGLEKILADLERKYRTVDPENIALGAQRFERILNSVVVPFIGLNAFLLSGLALYHLFPEKILSLFVCNLAAALVVAGWIYHNRSRSYPVPVLFFSAVPTFLLAAFLTLQWPVIDLLLAVAVTYGFVALVYSSKIPQTAVPVYVIYVPILLSNLQTEQGYRLATEFLTLVPLGIVFVRQRLRVAASAVLISAVITAFLESGNKSARTAVSLLLFLLVAVGIWYEVRISKTDYSPVRMLLDQSLLVLLVYLALHSLGFTSDDRLLWTWSIAVTLYEAVQCWREKFSNAPRIGVAALALTVALWMTNKPMPPSVPIGGALLIAALTNVAALRLGSSLLSTTGFVLLIPGVLKLYDLGDRSLSSTVIVLGLLTTAGVLLIAGRPSFVAAQPWWHGFIQEKHLEWTRSVLLTAGGAVLKISIVAFVFNIFRSCFRWLRYFKGKTAQFGIADFFYAAGHFYGALIVSGQVQLLAAARGTSANTQLTIATALWVVWGLVIFFIGVRNGTIYQRFIGLALLITPAALYFPAISAGVAPWALVSMVVGGAFWLVGILRGSQQDATSGDQYEEKCDEDAAPAT